MGRGVVAEVRCGGNKRDKGDLGFGIKRATATEMEVVDERSGCVSEINLWWLSQDGVENKTTRQDGSIKTLGISLIHISSHPSFGIDLLQSPGQGPGSKSPETNW